MPAPARAPALPPRASARRASPATTPTTRVVGEPLCPECFDYRGAVLWNAHVPRAVGADVAPPLPRGGPGRRAERPRELRSVARLSYIKVVEFQRRGLVHLHVVLRADGGGRAGRAAAALARRRRPRPARSRGPWPRLGVAVPACAGTGAAPGPLGRPDDVRVLVAGDEADADGHRRLRGQVRHQDGRRDAVAGPSDPLAGRDRAPRAAAPHRAPWCARPGRSGGRRSWPHLRLRDHAHTLGYPASSPPRACASRPPSGRCAGPGPHYVRGRRRGRLRLRRRVALRRPGLRAPPRRPSWPGASIRRPAASPPVSPAGSQMSPQSHELGKRLQRNFGWGRIVERVGEPF